MDTSEYDTNTLLNNNISSIIYRVYEPSQEHAQTFPSAAADIETELRNRGHIVYYDATRRVLWYFHIPSKDAVLGDESHGILGNSVSIAGATLLTVDDGSFEPVSLFKGRAPGQQPVNTPTSSSSSNSALDLSLRNQQTGTSAPPTSFDPEPKGTGLIALPDAYEQFITAVLSTVSAVFCSRVSAIPLNHRTVLLPSKVMRDGQAERALDTESAVVGTFRIYLTTTGTLVMSLALSCCEGLLSVNEPCSPSQLVLGSQILAAPFGVLANYQGFVGGGLSYPELGLGQTPDAQLWRGADARSSQWRDTCINILQSRGLSPTLLQSCPWIALQMLRRKSGEHKIEGKTTPFPSTLATISWPAVLCFRKKSVMLARNNGLGDPVLLAQDETSDFLNEARTWFQLGTERDEKISRRKKEREIAASKEAAAVAPAQQANGHSPLGLRRASNAAAAGTMYPTPPDGVQNPLGITPSMDGTTSSPGAPGTTMAVVDIDTTMADTGTHDTPAMNTNQHSEAYGDGWHSSDSKRDRADSFLAGDNDNLFGDMGPDMFGDTDITDADFSFFDEEGGDDLDLSVLPDLGMPDAPPAPPAIPVPVPEPAKLMLPVGEEAKPALSPPIFAKPELKHARSTLLDEGKQKSNGERTAGVKRESSPFDPDTVYKRVRASLADLRSTPQRTPARKGSVFDSVDFDPVLPLVNKKYEQGGRFDCLPRFQGQPQDASKQIVSQGPPMTDYLRRHGKQRKTLRQPERTNAVIRTITGSLENSSLVASPGKGDDLASDADDISLVSDQDDSSASEDEPASPFKSSIRRLNLDDDVASHVTSLKDIESVDDSDPALALDLPKLAKAEASELLIPKYFEDAESLPIYLSLPDEDTITIAQIVTEQAVTGNLRIRDALANTLNTAIVSDTRRQLSSLGRTALQALREVIPPCLGEFNTCNFKGLVEVSDVPLIGPPSRLHPRPVNPRDNAEPPKPNNIFQIPAPHMELRRAEARLSVLPASVQFWESLGLGPAQGTKDVNVVCVFPHWDGMSDVATAFLDRMRNVYELLKLGSFERLPSSPKVADGLLPFEADKVATSPGTVSPHIVAALGERMEALNQSLLSANAKGKNFVIYFVYPPDHPGSIVEACTAFQQLFEMHKRSLTDKRQTPANELVLQLVPLDFLTSSKGMVEPTPSDAIKLAIETYDRCTLFGGPMPSPAIILEQSFPRGIDFKLSATSSSSLMHENTCIHIAYAQSIDERWITAAWTDNRGCQQMTASYNLGRKGKPLSTSLNDVCHEIWETTHDLISKWKVHWRVVISKCGFMDAQEIGFWQGLAQTESVATVSLTLISVDTNPSMQLVPPAIKVSATAPSAFYTTPVSTPQPSIVSPEQSGTPVTPMKENNPVNAATPGGTLGDGNAEPTEGDAILLDVTDQSWGAVLAHRLNNSCSLGELNPALISGYLVKRGGTKLEDPPVIMEVNIVHADNNPRMYEPLMREMLTYFRGLGTLARARGVTDRGTDVRPWHIAAAEKGVRALYLLM
ncbi:hypothetical protein LZ32DRAFT_202453 [Colletotrichum eremochloae]|nr:hypothetical protein LZ32DRAFT_202453 [Colletotrichum eremochloae]